MRKITCVCDLEAIAKCRCSVLLILCQYLAPAHGTKVIQASCTTHLHSSTPFSLIVQMCVCVWGHIHMYIFMYHFSSAKFDTLLFLCVGVLKHPKHGFMRTVQH